MKADADKLDFGRRDAISILLILLILVILIALTMLSTGCAAWVRHNSEVVSITNGTQYLLEVRQVGDHRVRRISPGGDAEFRFYAPRYTNGYRGIYDNREIVVKVKAYDENGDFVGAVDYRFSVGGRRRDQSRIVRNWSLRTGLGW